MALGRRCRWGAAGVFLLIGVVPAQARADDAAPTGMTVSVEYRAPTGCPSRGELLDSVRRYTTRWSLVDDGASRGFAIVLDRTSASARGTLEIAVGGRKTRKVVSGPTCATVARALAVMVALVIDPGASIAGREEPVSPTDTSPEPERSDEPPEIEASPEGSEDAPPSQATIPRKKGRRARPTKSNAVTSAPRWMFELRHEMSSAVTSRAMTLIGGSVDLQVPLFRGRDPRSSVIGASSVGIGLRQSLPRGVGVPGGSTDFLWSAGTMRICPLRLRLLGDQLDLAPCVEGNVGVLRAESHGIPFAQRTRKHWIDGGVSALGVWHLPGPWVATAAVALVTPLTRHRFEVVELASLSAASGPRTELVSQAPILGITAGLGLGLEL